MAITTEQLDQHVVTSEKLATSLTIPTLDITTPSIGGTAITATAAEINSVADQSAVADGINALKVARFTFDPTANATERTAAAHGLGVTLPDNAVVLGGGLEILTTFTSGDDSATIALHIQGANDLITATAISSGTFWDAVKWKVVVPDGLAASGVATPIKLTAAREVTATVDVQALTGGKFVGFLYYVIGA